MQFIIPCYLCKKTSEGIAERKVYASMASATRTEFYKADANGHKIENVLTVRAFEYRGEEQLKRDGELFVILRAYNKGNGTIELSLIRETRIYEEPAILLWTQLEAGEIVEKSLEVHIKNNAELGEEFFASIQSGMKTTYSFKMKASEFALSKHLAKDTLKPLYASKIKYNEAIYDIVKTSKEKDIDEITVECN